MRPYPIWFAEYLERFCGEFGTSCLLNRLCELLEEGKSDEEIGRQLGTTADRIHAWRTHWKLIRKHECSLCGCKEYNEEDGCDNPRCVSNWMPEHESRH